MRRAGALQTHCGPVCLPSVPGVHPQVVQQEAAEIEGRLGFGRTRWLLPGHFHAEVRAAFQHILCFLGALPHQRLGDGVLLVAAHAEGRWRRLVQLALGMQEALRAAAPNLLQQLVQRIFSFFRLRNVFLGKDAALGLCRDGEGAGRAVRRQAALQRAVQHPAVPRVLPRDVPHDHPHVRGGRGRLGARLLLGGDLEVGDERAVVEDEELQVGAAEDVRGQLGGVHEGVVVVLAQQAVQDGRAPAQRVVAQVVHQVRHHHPRRQGDQLQVPPPLL